MLLCCLHCTAIVSAGLVHCLASVLLVCVCHGTWLYCLSACLFEGCSVLPPCCVSYSAFFSCVSFSAPHCPPVSQCATLLCLLKVTRLLTGQKKKGPEKVQTKQPPLSLSWTVDLGLWPPLSHCLLGIIDQCTALAAHLHRWAHFSRPPAHFSWPRLLLTGPASPFCLHNAIDIQHEAGEPDPESPARISGEGMNARRNVSIRRRPTLMSLALAH